LVCQSSNRVNDTFLEINIDNFGIWSDFP
jgi:hypothetical protein